MIQVSPLPKTDSQSRTIQPSKYLISQRRLLKIRRWSLFEPEVRVSGAECSKPIWLLCLSRMIRWSPWSKKARSHWLTRVRGTLKMLCLIMVIRPTIWKIVTTTKSSKRKARGSASFSTGEIKSTKLRSVPAPNPQGISLPWYLKTRARLATARVLETITSEIWSKKLVQGITQITPSLIWTTIFSSDTSPKTSATPHWSKAYPTSSLTNCTLISCSPASTILPDRHFIQMIIWVGKEELLLLSRGRREKE